MAADVAAGAVADGADIENPATEPGFDGDGVAQWSSLTVIK
ncbi:hypothetical protein [Mycolicibacterium sarraceniae]|nr:hypothetical protein [Mycolicibacterium sarraceniae]